MTGIGPTVRAGISSSVKAALSMPPSIDYPIKLTADSPYVMGRAALVFVSPNIVNPADNFAEYGWEDWEDVGGEVGLTNVHRPPHEGACVVAWFRPPVAERKYNVDFSCMGVQGHTFILGSEGGTETINIGTAVEYPEYRPLEKAAAGKTFEADDLGWKWFALSSDQRWRLLSFEVILLPD